MDYTKLNWSSNGMYSEVLDKNIPEDEDVVVGLYSLIDFPEINMYIDVENEKILKVWLEHMEE